MKRLSFGVAPVVAHHEVLLAGTTLVGGRLLVTVPAGR